MKKLILALCLIVFSLTGCSGGTKPIVDNNGDVIHVPESQIEEGYYIQKEDGMYYQILKTDSGTDNKSNIYLWFTEPYDAAIPRFTINDKLMYYSETDRFENVTLYKMTDYGYTLGIMFETSEGDLKRPTQIKLAKKYNPYSKVQSVMESIETSSADTYVVGINNHEFTRNLLVDDSFLKGLTKDAMYQLGIYFGTVYKTVNIKADSHLFLQEAAYSTSA